MYERVWERKGKGVGEKRRGSRREKERGRGERKRDGGEGWGGGERGREILGEGWGSRERSNLPISSLLFIVVCIHHMHTPMGWPLAKIYSNLTFVH